MSFLKPSFVLVIQTSICFKVHFVRCGIKIDRIKAFNRSDIFKHRLSITMQNYRGL